jgi:ferredoxin, 2Fe-2S
MNKRALTVGSLIPRNTIINKVSKLDSTQEDNHLNKINLLQNQVSIPGNTIINKVSKLVQPKHEGHYLNKIILLQNEIKFEIQPTKGNLLEVALEQEQTLQYKCRKGTCGACTVKVAKGGTCLSPPNENEQKKLKEALNGGYRLACQTEIL